MPFVGRVLVWLVIGAALGSVLCQWEADWARLVRDQWAVLPAVTPLPANAAPTRHGPVHVTVSDVQLLLDNPAEAAASSLSLPADVPPPVLHDRDFGLEFPGCACALRHQTGPQFMFDS